ncbi:MAG: SpoIIE family protein phosphatase [Nitrospirae bacterium]|nr:SpoIIE family protein phosphatase [Nitrospirota bacterium]
MGDHDILKEYAAGFARYLSDQTTMIIFILNGEGSIVWVNAAFKEMVGRREPMEGLDIRDLLAPESRELLGEVGGMIIDGMKLIFSSDKQSSHILTCRVLSSEENMLVLSEQVIATETTVMKHMTAVNNDMSNLTPELYRKNEAMKYREEYNILQQESAFKKEFNIIRNDLFLKKVDVVNSRGAAVEWAIDLYYKPLDILSGDSYSIRAIEDGKVLIYIADAMGKGLAASVTSILSTSFANHLVNEALEGTGFDFREFIAAYSGFIRKELIEEEILCVTFLFLDLVNETMDTAVCAMPPVLCHAADDTIVRIESNNMPLMMYPAEMRIDRYDLADFHKILAHTDGVNESVRNDDSLYQECLEEHFRQSEFSNHLSGWFNEAVQKPDDDVTFIFVRRIDRNPKWTKVFTIASRLEEVTVVTTELEEFLDTLDADAGFKVIFISAFNEMLMNAYEHGSLNIDFEHKSRLVRDDTYQDYLLDVEKDIAKKIDITLSLHELNGNDYLMLTVTDEGKGFDTSPLRELVPNFCSVNGRGIQMAQCSTDELFYNRVGNEVTLLKRISTSVHK